MPDGALVPDRADFARIAVEHCRDDRKHGIDRKVDGAVSVFRLLGDVARFEAHNAHVTYDFGPIR